MCVNNLPRVALDNPGQVVNTCVHNKTSIDRNVFFKEISASEI